MIFLRAITMLILPLSICHAASAQEAPSDKQLIELPIIHTVPIHSWYGSNAMDAAIVSTSLLKTATEATKFTTPRFTLFLNIGTHLNYNLSTRFGFFTGLTLKNIGLIRSQGDTTIKHRVYALGIPLGVRLGNLETKSFVAFGGGLDFAVNYREKAFTDRKQKSVFNEWGSDRVRKLMPYLFLGFQTFPGINFKLQYYPLNFFNPDFTETVNGSTRAPYAGLQASLINLNIGFNIRYNSKITFRYYNRDAANYP